MAEAAGALSAVPQLKASLEEEQAMAEWLEMHLPQVTQRYIALETAGEKASR